MCGDGLPARLRRIKNTTKRVLNIVHERVVSKGSARSLMILKAKSVTLPLLL